MSEKEIALLNMIVAAQAESREELVLSTFQTITIHLN
jgi:hypothetical protein